MARVRVHQHVNPLAKYYREIPVSPLILAESYADADKPLHIDIGCGRGRFLLEMAKTDPESNFLGVEIREPLVVEANQIRDDLGLKNLHYEFCNASLDMDVLLKEIPAEILRMVTIQFPDPWFKKRHAKRRMVKDELIETIAGKLAPGGRVFVQTDVEFLAEEMFELFENCGYFTRHEKNENLLAVKTEREISVENRNLPVFRALFTSKS